MRFVITYYVDHQLRVADAVEETLLADLRAIRCGGGYDITIEVRP